MITKKCEMSSVEIHQIIKKRQYFSSLFAPRNNASNTKPRGLIISLFLLNKTLIFSNIYITMFSSSRTGFQLNVILSNFVNLLFSNSLS